MVEGILPNIAAWLFTTPEIAAPLGRELKPVRTPVPIPAPAPVPLAIPAPRCFLYVHLDISY